MVWTINESSPSRKMLTDSVAKIIALFLFSRSQFIPLQRSFSWADGQTGEGRFLVLYVDTSACSECLWWERASFSSGELREERVGIRVHLVGNILEMWDDAWQGSWVTLKKTGEGVAPLPCMQRNHSLSPAWGHQMFLPTDLTDSPSQQR